MLFFETAFNLTYRVHKIRNGGGRWRSTNKVRNYVLRERRFYQAGVFVFSRNVVAINGAKQLLKPVFSYELSQCVFQ